MAIAHQKFKNIVGFQTPSGDLLGFHHHNFELAQIDSEIWQALSQPEKSSPELIQELEAWSAELQPEIQHISLKQKVAAFSINVSQVCNLNCEYCGAGGDGTYGSKVTKINLEPTYQQIRHFMTQLSPGANFHIRFFGGEPLLYPTQLKKMAEYAHQLSQDLQLELDMVVVTNGTLITEKVAKFLADYHFNVTISLDSTPEINDVVRPLKGKGSSTALTLKGVENLLAHRDQLKLLKFSSVFGDHNFDIIKTYNFLEKFGFDLYSFNNAASEEEQSTENYLTALYELAQYVYEREGIEKLFHITPFREYLLRVDQKKHVENHCGAGKTYVHTDTQNDLYSCNWLMTDINEKIGHQTQIDAQSAKQYQPSLVEKHQCHSCWAKNLCGGGCLFYNKMKMGDKNKKDLSFCKKTKGIILIILEFYAKEQLKGA